MTALPCSRPAPCTRRPAANHVVLHVRFGWGPCARSSFPHHHVAGRAVRYLSRTDFIYSRGQHSYLAHARKGSCGCLIAKSRQIRVEQEKEIRVSCQINENTHDTCMTVALLREEDIYAKKRIYTCSHIYSYLVTCVSQYKNVDTGRDA